MLVINVQSVSVVHTACNRMSSANFPYSQTLNSYYTEDQKELTSPERTYCHTVEVQTKRNCLRSTASHYGG